ncbi:hypothetical protein [Methylobacterium durans]|uniref:hypothetical protein n=1 Tax=Methylobacterium durans TaxID=2202825 RepID=UPI001F3A5BC5|nr:hypothetical protein [Methylobacterium durans]
MAVGIDRALADTGVGAANAAVHDVRGGSVRWLVLLLVLAAGWGALFSYSVVFLAEDLPLRPVSPRPGIGSAPEDTSTFELPPELMRTSGTAVQRRPEARAPEAVERPASRLMLAEASTAAAAPEAAPIRTAAIPAAAPSIGSTISAPGDRPKLPAGCAPGDAATCPRGSRRTVPGPGARSAASTIEPEAGTPG